MARKAKGIVKTVEVDAHKAAKGVRQANGWANMAEVLASGDPRRIARWLIRKEGNSLAQKGINKATGLVDKVAPRHKK